MSKEKKNKTTSEKPVSLSPLNFKDAIEALLKVKPEEDADMKSENKEEEKMIDNSCEKEKKELEKAEINLQTHLADPLNQRDDFPESFQKETAKLKAEIKEKEETLKNCLEKNKKA